MSSERVLFSESWHRVARQKIRLRPSVTVHKQYFRGELWYVARDAYGDQYYRFRPEAWAFIARLDGRHTVEEIWNQCLEHHQGDAPGQGEVVQMLTQLYQGNLIFGDVSADAVQLFERLKKRKANEWKARLFGIFYLRIPLWDPDGFLNRTLPVIRPFISLFGAILWSVMAVIGIGLVISNWGQLTALSAGVLDPSNLILLYLSFAFAKVIHEMGHAYAVKRFGGEVHRMGITFLVFTPIPYVDATAAWAFRERWKRVWVGAAGMIVELFLAAVAVVVWAYTGPGLINGIAYNLMIVASVSTLLFNLNPLLRFDGYYILSDLTDSPNLSGRSNQQWLYWIEHYAFGGKNAYKPSDTKADATWLGVFGVTAWVYRIFITYTIIMFVADKFFGLGFLAAVLTIIGFIIVPLYKGVKFLLTEPRIQNVRSRALGVTAGFLAILFILLGVVPFPDHFRAPGVIKASPSQYVITESAGKVDEVYAYGSDVSETELLLRMSNPELELEIENLKSELSEIDAMERRSFSTAPVELAPLSEQRRFVEAKLSNRTKLRENLELRAPLTGHALLFNAHELTGRWLDKGSVVGELIGKGDWEFQVVVSQDDANMLFDEDSVAFEIRFPGSVKKVFTPSEIRLVPSEQEFLPSPALGWPSGGSIRLSDRDQTGLRAYEPFFLVVGLLPEEEANFWHGRTGVARFDAPSKPLLWQWVHDLRQVLQRRFQL